MIGSLTGKIIEKQSPFLLLDVHGVGYEIAASTNTIDKLPDLGETITLHTHFVVREDGQFLYGFIDRQERALFRILIKVSGVGPKVALSILSSIHVEDFVRCVYQQDMATLVKLPGIGKKTAERLMMEMRDKLKDMEQLVNKSISTQDAHKAANSQAMNYQDAISALISLGYSDQQSRYALSGISNQIESTGDMVKSALKIINNQ